MNDLNKIGVYKITTPSNKVYIGMTTDSFKNRWNTHLKLLKNPNKSHHCKGLQSAFDKYGWDNLNKEILQIWDKPNDLKGFIPLRNKILLIEKETYLAYKDYGYNMLHSCPTGTGSVVKNEDIRKAISDGIKSANNLRNYCMIFNLICISCKLPFTCKNAKGKYCSNDCERIYNNKSLTKKRRTLDEDDISNVYNLYIEEGKSITEISKIYQLSVGTLFNFMRKYEIPTRNLSEANKNIAKENRSSTKGYKYPKVCCTICKKEYAIHVFNQHFKKLHL